MINKASDSIKKVLLVIPILILIYIFSCEEIEYFKKPTVKTIRVENTTSSSTNAIGEIVNLEDNDIIDFGFCWSVNNKPTKEGSYISIDLKLLDNVFSNVIDEFEHGQQYYIRAFATNEVGTGYGNELSFITDDGNIIITTTEITNITPISAISGGNITDDGGASVTVRGICWNTTGNPVITDSIRVEGDGTGSFIINLSGLNVGTKHYVRAYATNEVGTSYGNEINFTTEDGLPVLSTSDVSNITSTTATSGGNITDDSGFAVNARGVCWSTSSNPTTEDTHTTEGNETDNFESEITGLTEGTSYYVRAYATNENGTAYGEELIFMSNIVDFDGNEYAIVKIGEQIWMAENMSAIHYANGTPLVDGSGVGAIWEDTTTKYYFSYDDNNDNVATYGRLYTWAAAMNGLLGSVTYSLNVQGICPDGWHMPGDAEWKELEMYLGMSQEDADNFGIRGTDEGNKLKSITGWSSDGNGTNESGFSALPSGRRDGDNFRSIYLKTFFWSGIDDHDGNPLARRLVFDEEGVGSDGTGGENGFSVRCIKGVVSPTVTTNTVSDITETSATVGGNVTSDGGDAVTENGIYYSTTANSETTGTKLQIGSGMGEFSTSLTGLSVGITYYIKAYAINSIGTIYGDELSFTTGQAAVLPTVTTSSVSDLAGSSATVGGDVTDDGGATVTERGIYYSTTASPETTGTKLQIDSGTGEFSTSLTGLSSGTTYYIKAYATNSAGTSYGSQESFTTLTIPTVTTSSATDIADTSATVGGNVTSDGGAVVTERGIYYSTTASSETTGTKLQIGSGIGEFSASLTGLTLSTTYYIKAYATNSIGTSYGDEVTFATITKPTLTTIATSHIETNSAQSGGNITDDGGAEVTDRGVCYNTSPNPDINDYTVHDGDNGIGIFNCTINSLMPGTVYYLRAFATNSRGTAYGNEIIFKTMSGTVTDLDGNVYFTVLIGAQEWMAENLKTTHYANGVEISLVESNSAWLELLVTDKAYCYHDNSTINRDTYGALYTWAAAMNGAESSDANPSGIQGVCPEGWYMPGDSEWKELEVYLGMSPTDADAIGLRGTDEGSKLKSASGWGSDDDGTNSSGFTALPGGYRNEDGTFYQLSTHTQFWSASEYDGSRMWTRALFHKDPRVTRGNNVKIDGYSVRCLKGAVYPIVTTNSVSDIAEVSATVGGNVTSDGGETVTERGVCYGTTANPETNGTKLQIGSGTGTFSTSLTGLSPGTTYYIKAYATNSIGTSYGSQESFTTTATTPTVTTSTATDIAETSATVGGNVTADGGAVVTDRGIYYSTTSSPETSGTELQIGSGVGEFSTSLPGLSSGTTYYIKAYAINSIGTSYGSEETFTTLTTPTVTTEVISAITGNSAQSGGNVSSDGGASVTACGVCWSATNPNPTITDSLTTDGSGTGVFTSSLTGLSSETTYYVRAYATNSVGTAYGSEETFTTLTIPTVTTEVISAITDNLAQSGGNVSSDGGASVTARGVCWSATNSNPTITDSHTTDGSGTGVFTSSLTGLLSGTTYYVRAYATNSVGTAYGSEEIFTTDLVDYDGNTYNTVQIGNQIWMAENLKTTHYANGAEITLVENASAWDLLTYTDTAYCYYDNLSTNGETYGALYTWAAATNGISSNANPSGVQGACPDGWHLPSDAEWKELEMYLGLSQAEADATGFRGTNEGSKLAGNASLWIDGILENDAAFGISGFTALPAGYRNFNGTFYSLGYGAYFWSATEYDASYAWGRTLRYNSYGVSRTNDNKNSGFSVRCTKD